MKPLVERDYFSDHSILLDPYDYFDAVRAKGPVYRLPESGIVVVTGFEEALEVLKNTADFSSVIAPQGPVPPLPFTPEGPDLTPQIEANRDKIVAGDLVVTFDDHRHAMVRALLMPLFTPTRLKASEKFVTSFSEELVKEMVAKGGGEVVKTIATPFVTLVIADLLGVPEDDRKVFMDVIAAAPPPGSLNSDDLAVMNEPLVVMGRYFAGYVFDRRANPRDDIMSMLANSKFPDGTMPDALDVVKLATFLFGAGQDTSAKLLGNALRYIADQPGLQAQLRQDPKLIAPMLEEVLRLEGSSKITTRLARKATRIGDYEIPVGTKVLVALAAANRDPRRWENPNRFELNRPKIKENVAFGRGAHVCAGAPLARIEIRIIIEKFLELTSHIDLDEEKHGPRGNRTLDYEASFIVRGLNELHLKLTPA